jgi:hypothetical protein
MKIKSYYLVVILMIFACSPEGTSINPVVESFTPRAISFVYEDGSSITAGECLSPNLAYAIQIETIKNEKVTTMVSQVEYTVNGVLYSMSFSAVGSSYLPIELVEGRNIAQLVETGLTKEIAYVLEDDFILVD